MKMDLKKFCGERVEKFDFTEPFVLGQWRYASDSRICVRVPALHEPESPRVSTLPPVEALPWDFLSLPTGEWKASASFEDWDTCPTCHGVEEVKCMTCHGKRIALQIARHRINGILVRNDFFSAIRELPDVRLVLDATQKRFVKFLFAGGGQGMVAAMSEKASETGREIAPIAA